MAAFDPATLDRWRALAIVDRDGTTVGTISEFYLDRETGYPTWALVNTGLFGATQTFVPLVHATEISDGLQVPYEKSHIKDTPRVDLHGELSPDEEATLFAHYGVEYQPSSDPIPPTTQDPSAPPPAGTPRAAAAEGPRAASPEDPGAVPPEPGSVEGPGSVPAEPGSVEGPGPIPAEPGSVESPGPVPPEAGSVEGRAAATGAGPGAFTTGRPDDATLVASGGLTPEHHAGPAGPDTGRPWPPDNVADPSQVPPADPALSRTAPVERGLPGSTAASPGPVPSTIDKGVTGDPAARPADETYQGPSDEAVWPPPAPGGFDGHEPADQPASASDRWREAKLAAERDRIARAAAAQHEERSPLERARRRLERLVGVGQDDPDDISPAEREAAERARRARLGLEDDDPRMR